MSTIELSDKANERLNALRFVGELSESDAVARGQNFVHTEHGAEGANDHISMTVLVDADEIIQDIRFATLASAVGLLTFDLLSEWCIGKQLREVGVLTPILLNEYAEDEDYGFAVGDTGASAPDKPYVILTKLAGRSQKKNEKKEASKKSGATADQLPWDEVGLFEKVRRIEETLDEHVREALANDGGGIELIDLREGNATELVVQYTGQCGDCGSALGGTLQFIEDTLEANLNIRFTIIVQGMESEPYFSL